MAIPTTTVQYSFPQMGSYENLVKSEAPTSKIKANDVLVKIHATSLQYRDLMVSKGIYGTGLPANLVPLSDCAGEVLAVGEDVTGWKKGDRVCPNFSTDHIHGRTTPAIMATSLGGQAHGVLTQYRVFPAHSLVAIPAHLSYEEAATLPCAALTAYNALHGPVPIKAGDFVLALGTGGVSIFALQFAVAAGATVIATSSSDEKLKIAAKYGAKHLINYNTTPNWDEEVLKIVGGQGTLAKSIKSAKTGSGYIHIIGHVSSSEGDPSVIFPLIRGAVTLRGILIGSVAQFNDMNRLILANPDTTRPVIDKVFTFDEAIAAYAYLESQKHVGKIVIKVA
uniref:Enoyl reductase (ER) domain-containing protein n=1 Tax=Psilocybe cubensis TaxID=181762 RepID=A0A8H7XWP5_PSICU